MSVSFVCVGICSLSHLKAEREREREREIRNQGIKEQETVSTQHILYIHIYTHIHTYTQTYMYVCMYVYEGAQGIHIYRHMFH